MTDRTSHRRHPMAGATPRPRTGSASLRWGLGGALGALLATTAACLPLAGEDDAGHASVSGGTVSVEDAYAATIALLATSQLSALVAGETTIGEDDASAVAARMRKQLATLGCGQVSGQAAAVTLTLGAGCSLPEGAIPVIGTIEMQVAVQGKGTQAALVIDCKLDGFGSGGKVADGGATITARAGQRGLQVSITSAMTSGSAALTGGLQVERIAANADGPARILFSTLSDTAVATSGATLSVDASAVRLDLGSCYPAAGTVVVTSSGVKATLAFGAATAGSGVAQFTPPLSTKAQDQSLGALGWACK